MNTIDGQVELVSYLGPSTEYRVRIAGDRHVLVQQSNRDAAEAVEVAQAVTLTISAEWCFLFKSAPATEAGLQSESLEPAAL